MYMYAFVRLLALLSVLSGLVFSAGFAWTIGALVATNFAMGVM